VLDEEREEVVTVEGLSSNQAGVDSILRQNAETPPLDDRSAEVISDPHFRLRR